MRISGLFQKKTMPNLNVGFIGLIICVFWAFNTTDSVAAAVTSCLPCYKCVSTDTDGNCTSCEYDGKTDCIVEPNNCGPMAACLPPKILNADTCKCECERISVCLGAATYNPDTCSCECNLTCTGDTKPDEILCKCITVAVTPTCKDGYYLSGSECKLCPDRDAQQKFYCGIRSSNDGIGGITDCYKEADSGLESVDGGMVKCKYSNDIGTYELESDCYYTDNGSGQIIEVGSATENEILAP